MHPTISFIMPVRGKMDFLIEQINAFFKFSERYSGFCELIIVGSAVENGVFKLAWLAIKLNKIGHPHVRARIIRYASNVELEELIRTGINSAIGEKIILVTDTTVKGNDLDGFGKRDVIVTRFLFDENFYRNFA